MKKKLLLMLIFVLALSLVACSTNRNTLNDEYNSGSIFTNDDSNIGSIIEIEENIEEVEENIEIFDETKLPYGAKQVHEMFGIDSSSYDVNPTQLMQNSKPNFVEVIMGDVDKNGINYTILMPNSELVEQYKDTKNDFVIDGNNGFSYVLDKKDYSINLNTELNNFSHWDIEFRVDDNENFVNNHWDGSGSPLTGNSEIYVAITKVNSYDDFCKEAIYSIKQNYNNNNRNGRGSEILITSAFDGYYTGAKFLSDSNIANKLLEYSQSTNIAKFVIDDYGTMYCINVRVLTTIYKGNDTNDVNKIARFNELALEICDDIEDMTFNIYGFFNELANVRKNITPIVEGYTW